MRPARKIPASLRLDRMIKTIITDRRRGTLDKTSYQHALEHAEHTRRHQPAPDAVPAPPAAVRPETSGPAA